MCQEQRQKKPKRSKTNEGGAVEQEKSPSKPFTGGSIMSPRNEQGALYSTYTYILACFHVSGQSHVHGLVASASR